MNHLRCSMMLWTIAVWGAGQLSLTAVDAESIVVTPGPIDIIPSGTVVADTAPEGWSRLVLKTKPSAKTGDVEKISESDRKYSKIFNTVMLANVVLAKGDDGRPAYVLDKVAVGCATDIGGNDTIVCPDSHKRLNADLGLLGGILLGEVCRKQRNVLLVAKTPTFGLVDAPVIVRWNGENRRMVYRYAFMVDAATGHLETIVWLNEPDEKGINDLAVSRIRWLEHDRVQDCSLHVDIDKYRFGVPTDLAFAVNRATDIREFDLPKRAERILAMDRYTAEQLPKLERLLRQSLARYTARLQNQLSR